MVMGFVTLLIPGVSQLKAPLVTMANLLKRVVCDKVGGV